MTTEEQQIELMIVLKYGSMHEAFYEMLNDRRQFTESEEILIRKWYGG